MPGDRLNKVEVLRLGKGLNLKQSALSMQHGQCIVAENCDRDTTYAIRKRNGNVLYDNLTTSQRVVGLFNYEFRTVDGDAIHQHLYVMDDGGLWMRDASMTSAQFQGGFWDRPTVPATRCSFAQTPSGEVYIAVGDGRMTVWTGTSRCYAGITPPVEPPTATAISASGSGITGDYFMRYTYIYRTRDNRTIESNPSPPNASVISPSAQAIRWEWTPPDAASEGERINGYRIYRTYAGADPNVGPYQFVTEILDLETAFYDDEVPDTLLSTIAPDDHFLPPIGGQFLLYHQNILFVIGSRANPNRINMSKLGVKEGEYEHFPASGHHIDVPSKTTLTCGAELHGAVVVTTSTELGHVTGSDPSNFVYRVMDSTVGCIAPESMISVGDSVLFHGQAGIYAWDGSRRYYLTKAVEQEFETNPVVNRRACLGTVYTRRTHAYFPVALKDGVIRWWVYDYDVSSASGVSAAPDNEDTQTRAWFRYSGKNGMMAATCINTLRDFNTGEEVVLWGTEDGKVYRFDQGLLDGDQPIELVYRFWVLPETSDVVSPKGQAIVWRHASLFFDTWEGPLSYGYGWWTGPFGRPGEIWRRKTIPRVVGHNNRARLNLTGNGYGAYLFELRHDAPGQLVFLGAEFWYRNLKRGLRGGRL